MCYTTTWTYPGMDVRVCSDIAWFWQRKAKGESNMKHIKTLNTKKLQNTVKKAAAANARHLASLHARHHVP